MDIEVLYRICTVWRVTRILPEITQLSTSLQHSYRHSSSHGPVLEKILEKHRSCREGQRRDQFIKSKAIISKVDTQIPKLQKANETK